MNDPEAESKGLLELTTHLTRELSALLGEAVDALYPGAFLAPLFKNHTKCRELVSEALSRYSSEPVQLPEQRRAVKRGTQVTSSRPSRRARATQHANTRRKQDAIKVIQAAGGLEEGTPLTFRPGTKREEQLLVPWVDEVPVRGKARWTNQPPAVNPLIWEIDGQRYSPSNLATTMMIAAGYSPPSGVRGTARWTVEHRGTLSDIAEQITNSSAENTDGRLW